MEIPFKGKWDGFGIPNDVRSSLRPRSSGLPVDAARRDSEDPGSPNAMPVPSTQAFVLLRPLNGNTARKQRKVSATQKVTRTTEPSIGAYRHSGESFSVVRGGLNGGRRALRRLGRPPGLDTAMRPDARNGLHFLQSVTFCWPVRPYPGRAIGSGVGEPSRRSIGRIVGHFNYEKMGSLFHKRKGSVCVESSRAAGTRTRPWGAARSESAFLAGHGREGRSSLGACAAGPSFSPEPAARRLSCEPECSIEGWRPRGWHF